MRDLVCTHPNCSRVYGADSPRAGQPIPFRSEGGLGSHRRRAHGLAAIGNTPRRADGGTFACDVPGCPAKPYRTLGGLGGHKHKVHGIISTDPETIARFARRHRAQLAALIAGQAQKKPKPGPLPSPPGMTNFQPKTPHPVLPANREWVRKRLLFLITQTLAAEIDQPPAVVRDLVLLALETNFAPPKHAAVVVPVINAFATRQSTLAETVARAQLRRAFPN